MGAIAASSHPEALDLFRRILIASAAVPVVFPPVYFEVEAGGKLYDEMHVDGSVVNQVFLYGPVLKPLVCSIAPRSVSSLIKAQGIGDLYRIYTTSLRDRFDFNLAFIPDEMDIANRHDEFDNRVMKVLFETGYKLAHDGYRWRKTPPGFFSVSQDDTIAQ